MLHFFQNLLNFNKTENQEEWVWCLVGNIVAEHEYGENKIIRRGTKQFSGGTKVYCFPVQWGDGYEKIRVIGKPRRQRKLVTVVIASKYVCNWRLKQVFVPYVVREMKQNHGWNKSVQSKNDIINLAKQLNSQ